MSIVFFDQYILPHIPIDSFLSYTLLSTCFLLLPLYILSRFSSFNFIETYIPNLILPFIVINFALFLALDWFNQYHVPSNAVIIKTFVTDKGHCHWRSGSCNQVDIFVRPKVVSIDNKQLFNSVEKGDIVYLKLQQGNLGNYFILGLNIVKNSYTFSL